VTYTYNAIHHSNLITYMQNVKFIFVVNGGLKQKMILPKFEKNE